jgi:hypothetical protein
MEKRISWCRSSYSGLENMCVEVADLDHGDRAVRDSKNPSGPALTFTAAQWSAFTTAVRAGQFN